MQIKVFIQRHQTLGLTYLAEKVEDKAEFERVKQLGIQLFQGFFFSRPEMVKQATMEPAQVVVMQLLNVVNEAEPDINKIEQLLGQDISLSLKLLRYVNHSQRPHQPYFVISPGCHLSGQHPAKALCFAGSRDQRRQGQERRALPDVDDPSPIL